MWSKDCVGQTEWAAAFSCSHVYGLMYIRRAEVVGKLDALSGFYKPVQRGLIRLASKFALTR